MCIICGYDGVEDQYYDQKTTGIPTHVICGCCGFESGFDDGYEEAKQATFQQEYRELWIKQGYKWFSGNKPHDWNESKLRAQLESISVNLDDLLNKK